MDAKAITNCLQDYQKLLDRADRIIAITEGLTFHATEVRLAFITPNAIVVDCYDGSLTYYEDVEVRIPMSLFQNEFDEKEVREAKKRGEIAHV